MTPRNQKLELTWIGKDNRPRLEPRILLEDPSHGDPLKLLAQYHALQADIAALRAALRDELQAALERSGHDA